MTNSGDQQRLRVLYYQPYVPAYRKPLFTRIDELLRQEGGSLTVAASSPDATMAHRNDAVDAPWLATVKTIQIPTPLGPLRYRRAINLMANPPRVVVTELDPANLNAWLGTFHPTTPLVLWGHGKTFTGPERGIVAHARSLLALRATHVMTYTEAGRQALIERGLPPRLVTAVGNSTDTRSLHAALVQRRRKPLDHSYAFNLDLRHKRPFAYLGGLDDDKCIPFLIDAAEHAHRLDPRFTLLVAGSGNREHILRTVDPAIVHWIPRANTEEVADLLSVSEAIWMPGRIGLVAVDALTAQIPIHTTNFPYHAPEFEFLREGIDVHIHPGDSRTFAIESLKTTSMRPRHNSAHNQIDHLSIETVAENMIGVLRSAVLQMTRAKR